MDGKSHLLILTYFSIILQMISNYKREGIDSFVGEIKKRKVENLVLI